LDARYRSKSVTDNLSKWLRDLVKSFPKLQDGCNSLKTFIQLNKSRILTDATSKAFSEKKETATIDIDQPATHDPSQAIAQARISVVNKENDGFVVFTDVKNEPNNDAPLVGDSIASETKKLFAKFSYGSSGKDSPATTFGV
jgi:hypothetical protein